MKNMTGGLLFCVVAFAMPLSHGGQEASGVYGVDVVVKENPRKRDVTNADGYFVLEALPPGSYTVSFRARPAKDMPHSTGDKVIVADIYSIKIEGAKRPVTRTGLTSDKLLAGVDVAVEVGTGGKVRGQVRPTSSKKMVWIAHRTGSHVPGHWVEERSEEASAQNVLVLSPGDWKAAGIIGK